MSRDDFCDWNDRKEKKENESPPLNLYPNPAQESFVLSWKEEFHKAHIAIHDASGRIIINQGWENDREIQFQTQTWKNGLYLITIETDEGKSYQRKCLFPNNTNSRLEKRRLFYF